VPPDIIAILRYLFTEIMDGRNAQTADGVERALGRPARDFADHVRDTATTGVWGPPLAQQPISSRRATQPDA
jgi:hypothetical protein